ncbi:MAG: hypothetical protein JO354_06325, partial [Verrucomicrobia bacterium]|nr:hypothetical protein [Verrucomicrobiota bacterium]
MPEETDSDKINTPAAFDGAEAIAAIIPAGPPPPAAEHEAYRDSGSQTGGNSNPDETNRPATKQPPRDGVSAPIAVVGIGASAGGVPVLQELFGKMSAETGLSFVVVMHLSPEHESNLAEILQRVTAMGVTQVTEETKVQPNCIYVIPPDKVLTMRDSMIIVSEGQRSEGRRVAIDLFFRTLAEQYGQRCACIILSGTDSDGVIGLKHIKAQGGVTIAQEPTEAEHSSMPRSAIDTGMVDWVLPVDQMPERLAQYARNELAMTLPAERDDSLATLPDLGPRGAGGPLISKRSDASEDESALHRVLVFLRSQTGHDFTHYKRATVLRRIARRLQVNQLESIPQYLEFLRTHPAEPRALLNDLLIGVTHFFRDQSAWATMEAHVPQLFAAKTSADQVRVWAPGCATGEEAYSIAILLLEHSFRLENPPQIQVFATDLDEDSVRFAREGIYPRTIEADVSEQRLRRFFFQQHGRYRIRKEVRELVLFADHDILRDSPFSKLDLVTCRNLLIYLKPDAQHRVIDVFHFALRAGGLLFLGGSENLDDNHSLFSPLDRKHRIFVRRAVPRMPIVNLAPFATRPAPVTPRLASRQVAKEFTPPEEQEKAPAEVAQGGGGTVRFESLGELHLKLLEATAPPSVVVDENHDILHMSAKAGEYLHFTAGEPSANLLRLVEESLR